MSIGRTGYLTPVLPDRIIEMGEAEKIEAIRVVRAKWCEKLVILGHHYQRESIVGISDYRGDSFKLSQIASSLERVAYIVFCGVHFMAESARVLASPKQRVFLPNHSAGCPMADMADLEEVEVAWEAIESVLGGDAVVPITYMNSTAAIKAFCGVRGGAVCTSSNANRVFSWALEAGRKVFFLPDEHLGRNTANSLGIPRDEQVLWDRKKPLGGVPESRLRSSRIILWNGFCHVHTHFTLEQMRAARSEHREAALVVHPECREEVVAEADAVGSTQFIVDYVNRAPAGAAIVIGTEINLVSRLAHEHPDKKVVPLSRSLCPNMFKINPGVLLHTLEKLGEINEIIVDPGVTRGARKALEKMLELS